MSAAVCDPKAAAEVTRTTVFSTPRNISIVLILVGRDELPASLQEKRFAWRCLEEKELIPLSSSDTGAN
jgi:hypothetical protein